MNKGKMKSGALFGKKPFQGQRKGPKAVIPNKGAASMPAAPPMPGMMGGGAAPPAGNAKAKMLAAMLAGGMPEPDMM